VQNPSSGFWSTSADQHQIKSTIATGCFAIIPGGLFATKIFGRFEWNTQFQSLH